jgi:hypothetical protein
MGTELQQDTGLFPTPVGMIRNEAAAKAERIRQIFHFLGLT